MFHTWAAKGMLISQNLISTLTQILPRNHLNNEPIWIILQPGRTLHISSFGTRLTWFKAMEPVLQKYYWSMPEVPLHLFERHSRVFWLDAFIRGAFCTADTPVHFPGASEEFSTSDSEFADASTLSSLSETRSWTYSYLCNDLFCSRGSCVLTKIFLSHSVASLTSCVSLTQIFINWCTSSCAASSYYIAKCIALTFKVSGSDTGHHGDIWTQEQELVSEWDLPWTRQGTYASWVCHSSSC